MFSFELQIFRYKCISTSNSINLSDTQTSEMLINNTFKLGIRMT